MTNEIIKGLLRSAYGGTGAAVVPGQDGPGSLPNAPAPAGVQQVLAYLQKHLQAPVASGGDSCWVFLVGGPGNGKSYQLAKLLERMQCSKPQSENNTARRAYDFPVGERKFHVVNDASIPADDVRPGDGKTGSLARDLSSAVKEGATDLLVNVNRGILIEEAERLDGTDTVAPGAGDVLRWLNSAMLGGGGGEARAYGEAFHPGEAGDYYATARLETANGSVGIYMIQLDQLSLLEPLPGDDGVALGGLGTPAFRAAEYRVVPFDASRAGTPAGSLLRQVVAPAKFEDGPCRGCSASAYCPFLANARTLRSEHGGRGFLKLLRASELASGRLLTYRELWTMICIAVVGRSRPEWGSARQGEEAGPCQWVEGQAAQLGPSGQGYGGRTEREVAAALSLGEHRLHVALYPEPIPECLGVGNGGLQDCEVSPAEAGLAKVDPVRDTSPDWARQVNDAMEGVAFGHSPGATLAASSEEARVCWTELDALVDDLHLEQHRIDGSPWRDVERRAVTAWRARQLYRLLGIAAARPAHDEVLSSMIDLRRQARQTSAEHTRIGAALTRTLLPEGGDGTSAYLPVFKSRTEPLRPPMDEATWCALVSVGRIVTRIRQHGDGLWMDLFDARARDRKVASLRVDFGLCRESLVAQDGGFTEAGGDAAPKLERTRASLIADSRKPEAIALVQATPHLVTVEGD